MVLPCVRLVGEKMNRENIWVGLSDYKSHLNSYSLVIHLNILFQILSFIHAESTFFHQGTDSFQDVEADLKTAAVNLETFSAGESRQRNGNHRNNGRTNRRSFHFCNSCFLAETWLRPGSNSLSSDMTTRQKLMEERHDLVQKRESTLRAESNLMTGKRPITANRRTNEPIFY